MATVIGGDIEIIKQPTQSNVFTIPLRSADTTTGFNSAQGKIDAKDIYDDLKALTNTNTSHAATFGNGETITEGVYNVGAAVAITGDLTLDGQGNADSVFVIKSGGAINSSAGATIILINGAKPENIHWAAKGAIGLGANTTASGTFISKDKAIASGANCIVNGRLLTKKGAVSFGLGTITAPTGLAFNVDYRTLSGFVLFSGDGAIANAGSSVYNGNIGTNKGAITNFNISTVNGFIYPKGSTLTQAISSFLMIPSNDNRQKVFIKNNTDKAIYINYGDTASELDFEIDPQEIWIEESYTGDINCFYEFNIVGRIKITEISI